MVPFMGHRKRAYGLRSRRRGTPSPSPESPSPPHAPSPPEPSPPTPEATAPRDEGRKPFREESEIMSPYCSRSHEKSRKLFTLEVHMDGEFKKNELGNRKWVGGWVRFVDWLHKDETDMRTLGEACGLLGLEGLCWYFYRKPFSTLDDGLVWLMKVKDVQGMCSL